MTQAEKQERVKKVAELLYKSFHTCGIHGKIDMPEDQSPDNVIIGSLEHLYFITLTVSIDYQRDAPTLWNNSRKTYEDPETRYLFSPELLAQTDIDKIVKDMQKYGLSKKPIRDAKIWYNIGITFLHKWGNNPLSFLENCHWNSQIVLEHLRNDFHIINGKCESDFPNLRGPKIGPLWVRMLRDNVGIKKLIYLENVPIPVDIHIARSTLTTGIIRGKYKGRLEDLFVNIREAWFQGIDGLIIKNRRMVALDIDEPLWHLSKYGCSKHREKDSGYCSVFGQCEAKDFCVKGIVRIEKSLVELDT